MDQKQLIGELKKEAQSNPAANDVFHVFAMRERARNQVTLQSLEQTMIKAGFKHPKTEYAAVLKRLGTLGLGRVEKDSKGHIKALKEVKATLQSIGNAACGKEGLRGFRQKNRFHKLATPRIHMAEVPKDDIVVLTFKINGKPVNVSVPPEFGTDDVAKLIDKFYRGA